MSGLVGVIALIALILLLSGTAFGIFFAIARQPSNNREWFRYLARLSRVTMDSETFTLDAVSDWTYLESGPQTRDYHPETYRFVDLRNVWFALEPEPGIAAAGHAFLFFEFSGDRLLGVSIEARRRIGQKFSPLKGLFNTYEIAYVWGEARDLLPRRAVMLKHTLYIYPTILPEEIKQNLLRNMLVRTRALQHKARFYNTFHSNCTNELAKAAHLPWHPTFVVTGYSAGRLFDLGVIPGETFDAAKARADVTDVIKALNGHASADEFDARLLQALRR